MKNGQNAVLALLAFFSPGFTTFGSKTVLGKIKAKTAFLCVFHPLLLLLAKKKAVLATIKLKQHF